MHENNMKHHRFSGLATLLLALVAGSGCNGSNSDSSSQTTTIANAATCSDPVVLTGSTTLNGESTSQATDGLSAEDASCIGFATHGADRVYKISVPATGNNKLQVVVTPSQSPGTQAFDPVVYATVDCAAAPTCVAPGVDDFGGGSAETFQYTNAAGPSQDLYVVVDGYDFQTSGGSYQLAVTLSPP